MRKQRKTRKRKRWKTTKAMPLGLLTFSLFLSFSLCAYDMCYCCRGPVSLRNVGQEGRRGGDSRGFRRYLSCLLPLCAYFILIRLLHLAQSILYRYSKTIFPSLLSHCLQSTTMTTTRTGTGTTKVERWRKWRRSRRCPLCRTASA